MLLRVLAEETGIGEFHVFGDLLNGHRRMPQKMLELGNRDIGNPFAGRLTATLFADL